MGSSLVCEGENRKVLKRQREVLRHRELNKVRKVSGGVMCKTNKMLRGP